MRIPRIYTPQALSENTQIELEPGPSQHLARALRMVPGDTLTLFNGAGGEYTATIVEAGKKAVVAATGSHKATELESPLRIHLGIAVSRGERMDWAVQKATELGVDVITPLFTERTEVKLSGERAEKKLRHWRQVAVSACEQCARNRIPLINNPSALDHWARQTDARCKLVLHHRADNRGLPDAADSVALLIGPEGGLSEAEIDSVLGQGFQSLRLGPRVLRAETAPLSAIAILQARWGDMQC